MQAQLAELKRPTKSQRRLDARRKILLGAFVLEHLEHTGLSPQAFSLDGKRFFEWLVRPNDRAVFEMPAANAPTPPENPAPGGGPRIAVTDTALNVPFADKDQAKALGAHWQPDKKRWVVPAGLDLALFTAWLD